MIPEIINIVSAELAGDLRIRLLFNDGTRQEVDFKPFLSASAHPQIRAYLNPEQFSAFRIEYGELVWGDYDLCFPVADLYSGRIDKSILLAAA
jgi:hypothetical protein